MRRYDLEELKRAVTVLMVRGHVKVLKEWDWGDEDMLILSRMLAEVEITVRDKISQHKTAPLSADQQQIDKLQSRLDKEKEKTARWRRIANDRLEMMEDRVQHKNEIEAKNIRLKGEIVGLESKVSRLEGNIKRLKAAPSPSLPTRAKIARLESEIQQYQKMLAEDLWDLEPVSCYYDCPPSPPTPEDYLIAAEAKDAVRRALSMLTPREEKILRMRFGIDEKFDHLLEEIGRDFEVTRSRINMIEHKALRKLRHPSRLKYLKSFEGSTLPMEPPKESKPVVRKRSGRRKDPHSKEQKVISLLRPLLESGCSATPHNVFTKMTGIDITSGQYARCKRTVLRELGRYEGKAKR